jgi:hypothetical protein
MLVHRGKLLLVRDLVYRTSSLLLAVCVLHDRGSRLGTADFIVGPKAVGGSSGNEFTTVPSQEYFAILTFCGPTEVAISKNWESGDLEKVE